MEQLFSREGCPMMANRTEKNRQYHHCPKPCTRCGGAGGSDKWRHTGWTCYECNGAKHLGYQNIRLYSQTELDKLNARRDALREKRMSEAKTLRSQTYHAFKAAHGEQMEAARPYAEKNEFLRKMLEQYDNFEALTHYQIEAVISSVKRNAEWAEKDRIRAELRQGSNWIGNEGERINIEGVVEMVAEFPCTLWNGDKGNMVITTVRDTAGNCIVVKGSALYDKEKREIKIKGDQVKLRGTVKAHEEYKGQKQTQLQRVVVQ